MGPRFNDRGKACARLPSIAPDVASMGPRFNDRGKSGLSRRPWAAS